MTDIRKELNSRSTSSNRFLPFRRYYANDNDSKISDIIFYFFNEVRNTFIENDKVLWDFEKINIPTNVLHTTIGYEALMKILVTILQENTIDRLDFKKAKELFYNKYLKKIRNINVKENNRYSFNQRGKKYFYLDMSLAIWPPKNKQDKRLVELKNLEDNN